MLADVLRTVLTPLIVLLLKAALNAIGVPVDEAFLNAVAVAFVTWFLLQIGLGVAQKIAPKYFM